MAPDDDGSASGSGGDPLVSVGLPAWNGLPYIEKSLTSLREQDFDSYEIVVCDNASTDGTGDYLRKQAAADDRIRYVRNDENIGGTRNFNLTLELARGRFFKWAGADDFVSSGVVSRCVELLRSDPSTVLAFPQTILVDEDGDEIEADDDGSGWDRSRPSRRFEFSLTRWGLCNLLYGVTRTDVLRDTCLLQDFPGSDLVLQADLAIRGRIRQVEGEHLYRRIHSQATGGLDEESLAQFYVPDRQESFDARFLRLFRHLAATAWSADVDLSEKRDMFSALLRHGIWARKRLAGELLTLIRRMPGSVTRLVGSGA